MNIKKYLTVNNILKAVAAILVLIAGIMFLATATTGYLTGRTYNVAVFWLALLAVLLILGGIALDKIYPRIGSVLLIIAGAIITLVVVLAVIDRANFIGDSFIPMDYPADFYIAIHQTISVFVLAIVGVVILAVTRFIPELPLVKEAR
jgi:hypothetical protein